MLRNNERRGQTAHTVFLAVSLFSLSYALFNFVYSFQLKNIGPDDLTTGPLLAFGWANQAGIVINSGLLLTSIVSFISWSRRAYANLAAVGVDTTYPHSQVVIGWFVPVLSLYQPYRIIREIWRSTQYRAFGYVTSHALVRIWWALFLFRTVLGIVVSAASSMMTLEAIRTSLQFTAAALLFDALAAWVTARMINRIRQFEQQLALTLNVQQLGLAAPEPASLSPTDPDLYL
ncbi:DUF4328 domain-containing protein [Hymenobacter pini]|uniref:DUF4328 domain-containing protein n=1 Tax=Hymenobacter pini TaxID=2880879 RepID=UPI001CF379E4|nr:DUF4328 domain-containing protein [Hymenobacter pini]MCA8829801.1 DUF4328 domain-containing protein [Hymenobacter pini]